MDIYRLAVYLGFTGLSVMALLGAVHLGDHGHGAGHAHGGNGHGHGGHAHGNGHGHAHGHNGHHGHSDQTHGGLAVKNVAASGMQGVLALLSPRVLFALSLGFGASGTFAKPFLMMEPARALVAICGALAFEKLLIGPVWNVWMGFASKPARTLESAVFEEAVALTNFDAEGDGVVTIDLDGHEMRVLARLTPEQRGQIRVRAGDKLFIEAVDATRGRCTVSAPKALSDEA